MSHGNALRRYVLPVFTMFLLSGCGSAQTPQLIASYPRQPEADLERYFPPESPLVAAGNYLAIEVTDVEWALRQAGYIADSNGGYSFDGQTWWEADGEHATIDLVVPVENFDSVYRSLSSLGRLISWEDNVDPVYPARGWDEWNPMASITVEFHPAHHLSENWCSTGIDLLAGMLLAGGVIFCVSLAIGLSVLFIVTMGKIVCWISRL